MAVLIPELWQECDVSTSRVSQTWKIVSARILLSNRTSLSTASSNLVATFQESARVANVSFTGTAGSRPVSGQREREHGLLLAGWQGQLFLDRQQDIPKAVKSSPIVMTPPLLTGQLLSGCWLSPRLGPCWNVQGHARRKLAPIWADGQRGEMPDCSRSSQGDEEEMTKEEEGKGLFK